jgi:hypothetical protein
VCRLLACLGRGRTCAKVRAWHGASSLSCRSNGACFATILGEITSDRWKTPKGAWKTLERCRKSNSITQQRFQEFLKISFLITTSGLRISHKISGQIMDAMIPRKREHTDQSIRNLTQPKSRATNSLLAIALLPEDRPPNPESNQTTLVSGCNNGFLENLGLLNHTFLDLSYKKIH